MTDPVAAPQHGDEFWPSGCSEFPNDNPVLHEGALWIVQRLSAPPRAVFPARSAPSVRAIGGAESTRSSEPPRTAAAHEETQSAAEAPLQSGIFTPQPLNVGTFAVTPSAAAEALQYVDSLNATPLAAVAVRPLAGPPRASSPAEVHEVVASEQRIFLDFAPLAEASERMVDEMVDQLVTAEVAELRETIPAPPDFDELSLDFDLDATSWTSQLESQDPFISDLASSLLGSAENGITATGDREADALFMTPAPLESRPAAESLQALAIQTLSVEPLSLEGMLQGVALPKPETLAPLQALAPIELDVELHTATTPEHEWEELAQGLSRFLMDRGASHAAIIVPRMLSGENVNLSRLSRVVQSCLVAEDFASEHDGVVLLRPEFRARARRLHRAFVNGTADREVFALWLATLVRAVLATPLAVSGVLGELKQAGVEVEPRAA